MLTRRENMASVIASEKETKKQNCRIATAATAKKHNKWFWTDEEKAILQNGTAKEIFDLGQKIKSGPKYLSINQYKHIVKSNYKYGHNLDMDIIKKYTKEEATDFIGGPLYKMNGIAMRELKRFEPLTEKQAYTIREMSMCTNIKMYMDFEIESLTCGEASDFIAKYNNTYVKFKAIKYSATVSAYIAEIKKLFAAQNEKSVLSDEAVLAWIDPDSLENTIKTLEAVKDDYAKAVVNFDTSTTLEPERKERTIEDEEEDEIKERREIERILYKLYETIGEAVPLNKIEEIKSIDDLREIGLYVKKFNNGLSPIFAFKGCKFFNFEEIAYITGATEEFVEKYLG